MINGVRKAKGNHPKSKTNNITPSTASSLELQFATLYLPTLLQDAVCALNGHYSFTDATFDINRITSRLHAEGLSFATKTLPSFMVELLKLLETKQASFAQFKLKKGYPYPVFLNRLVDLALNSVDHGIKTKAFDIIYSLTTAFKKLRGPYPTEVLRKKFADFIEVDVMLDKIDWFEESVYSIMESARATIAGLVSSWSLSDLRNLRPRPGPGAVNTKVEKHERYRPRVLYKQIDDVLNYQEWWYATPWHACLQSREFLSIYNNARQEPTARAKYVPKIFGDPRGICIEENEMQVAQQAVRQSLYDLIDDILSDHIALSDQTKNALAALQASLTLDDATIDESEASDRVARELVSWTFQDNEELHNVLMALSTRWVEPPLELKEYFPDPVRTKKYAPMGSALCFPIMSLVHYALILAIIEHSTDSYQQQREYCKRVKVYGDDIVVPSAMTPHVYYWLPKFGMKLNETKSFYQCHFRESCGIHAYHGVDVTPVYLKYSPYHDTPKALASVLDNERLLFDKGFFLTSALMRRSIRKTHGITDWVPDGLSHAGYARSLSESALKRFKLKRRRKWHRGLQTWTYAVDRLQQPIQKKVIPSDEAAYLRWLWVNAKNEGPLGQPFSRPSVGDSYQDLKKERRMVYESALGKGLLETTLRDAREKFPTSRIMERRSSVVCHKVVLRHANTLQQVGAAYGCAFV